jgi:hypothetical protein
MVVHLPSHLARARDSGASGGEGRPRAGRRHPMPVCLTQLHRVALTNAFEQVVQWCGWRCCAYSKYTGAVPWSAGCCSHSISGQLLVMSR